MPVVANQYNIVVEQGGTFTLEITYKDSDGDAIDLTDHAARLEIRTAYTSAETLIAITSASGGEGDISGIALGDAAGTIVIVIAAADTTALTAPATNVYDLELVSQNGKVTRLLEGKATVSPGVTQSTYTG